MNVKLFQGIVLASLFATLMLASSLSYAHDSSRGGCPDKKFGCAFVSNEIRIATILEDSIGGASGAELAVAKRRFLLGRKISLEHKGLGCDPDGVKKVAKKIVRDEGITAVIGTSCSGAAGVAVPILNREAYLTVSPSNTANFLTDSDFSFYFRTMFPDHSQDKKIAKFAIGELMATSAATVYDPNVAYSLEHQEFFEQYFTQMGGTLTAQMPIESHFEAENCDDIDFTSVINSLGDPDFVFAPLFLPDGACLISQLRGADRLMPVVATDSMMDFFLFNLLGPDPMDVYVSAFRIPEGHRYDRFVKDYKKFFGHEYDPTSDSPYEPYAYDAANIILDAIEKVAVDERHGRKRGLWIPRRALRDAMFGTINYRGVTGLLNCDNNGDCNPNSVGVYQATGGGFDPIRP